MRSWLKNFRVICGVVICYSVTCEALAQSLTAPENLRLIGGYRISRYSTRDNIKPDIASSTTGYPRGGMAAHTSTDGILTVWHENGEQGREVLESVSNGPMGRMVASPDKWPLLGEGNVWKINDLLPGIKTSAYTLPEGLAYDPEAERLWISYRSRYATSSDPKQWVAAVDYPAKTLNPSAKPNLSAIRMQRYGGGLTIIPKSWADMHTRGKRLAFVSGGLTGGQGGSAGPTFGVMNLQPNPNPTVTELMYFADTATIGRDRSNGPPYPTTKQVERAFTDYGPVKIDWAHPVEGDVGYFATTSIRGGGTWVETPKFSALMFMTVQPKGVIDYKSQTENLSHSRANNLYVYAPDDLAMVASGRLKPFQMRGKFYRWNAKNNGGIKSLARAICFDPGSGLLWIYYPKVWSSGVEKHPVVAAYELVPLPTSSE